MPKDHIINGLAAIAADRAFTANVSLRYFNKSELSSESMACKGTEAPSFTRKGLARLEKLHWRGVEGPVTVPEPLSAITWNHLRPILASLERVVELALICGAKNFPYENSPPSG